MSKQGVVNIKGKEYKTVALRVQEFRDTPKFQGWSIMTEIVKLDDDQVLIAAKIINPDSKIIATGHGHEFRTASQINSTSYVENAETSAIGRALACLGIGGTEFASANEVVNAIYQQNNPPKPQDIKPTSGAFEKMDEESQQFLRDLAIEVIADCESGDVNVAHQRLQSLDNDEKVAIWTLFNSVVRRALKDYSDSLKGV